MTFGHHLKQCLWSVYDHSNKEALIKDAMKAFEDEHVDACSFGFGGGALFSPDGSDSGGPSKAYLNPKRV